MLEKSIYYALASNLVFMVPLFQSAIASRKKRIDLTAAIPESLINESTGAGSHGYVTGFNEQHQQYTKRFYKNIETNFFARPPFNCLLCFTFWTAIIGVLIIPFLFGGVIDPRPAFVAPVLAVAFKRWLDSLPVKL